MREFWLAIRGVLMDSYNKKAPDTNDLTVDSPVIPEHEIWRVDHLAGYDATTANKRIKLSILRGVEEVTIQDKTAGTSDRVVAADNSIWAVPGERLRATIVSPDESDQCYLILSGLVFENPTLWEPKKEVTPIPAEA